MRALALVLLLAGCCNPSPRPVEPAPQIIERTVIERVPVGLRPAEAIDKVKREVDRLRAVTAPKPQRKPEPTP